VIIRQTIRDARPDFRLRQHGQEQARQNSNDCDDYQKFNQCERSVWTLGLGRPLESDIQTSAAPLGTGDQPHAGNYDKTVMESKKITITFEKRVICAAQRSGRARRGLPNRQISSPQEAPF